MRTPTGSKFARLNLVRSCTLIFLASCVVAPRYWYSCVCFRVASGAQLKKAGIPISAEKPKTTDILANLWWRLAYSSGFSVDTLHLLRNSFRGLSGLLRALETALGTCRRTWLLSMPNALSIAKTAKKIFIFSPNYLETLLHVILRNFQFDLLCWNTAW